jgi:hypothetical protein
MAAVLVHDLVPHRVLVTRDSARTLRPALIQVLEQGAGAVELDFSHVDGITPSFMDEVLRMLEEGSPPDDLKPLRIVIRNSPTRLSSKFAAIGRVHGLAMNEIQEGTWLVASADSVSSEPP